VLITIVFAAYAIALLTALLFVGSMSDHLGRKPLVLAALLIEMAAMILFIVAQGPAWLIAARIVQGVATGIAVASCGAALVDVDRVAGQVVNAVAPFLGMTAGVLGSAALVQFSPLPLQLVYALLLAIFAMLAAVLCLAVPETGLKRPGAWAALRPRVAVPRHIRRTFALISPINIAIWTLGGFYLSLVPALVAAVTGSRAPLTGGAVVGALMLAGSVTILLRRTRAAGANLSFGVLASSLGIIVVVAGIHLASVPLLIVGAVVTGIGFGTSFLGCVGSIVPLAAPDERAALLAAFYIQSYLAFSVPAIIAGYLAKTVGYAVTADVFGSAIVLASLAGLYGLRAERRQVVAA
jgi:MFS family permease